MTGKELLMPSPTIVLVHGAFADASAWRPVFDRLAGDVPDEGESVNDLQGRFPSLAMGPFVQPVSLPDGSVELSIDPARFHDVFCADLSDADASFMAISQRPVSAAAFDDPAAAAAWRAKPSWAVFGTADRPVAPELHRFSYDRAGS